MNTTRNLVLVHTPELQARSDFEQIARKARLLDETINVCLADNDTGAVDQELPARPTLIFSPIQLKKFAPTRGKVFQGGALDKLAQYKRFTARGIRTPKTAVLSRTSVFSEAEWGEYVVLKPLSFGLQSTGKSVYLIKTKRLNHDLHIANLFDRYDLPGGVIVQRFVNSGPDLEYHRLLALFGKPLYVMQTRLIEPTALDEKAHINGTIPVANLAFTRGEKDRDFVSDQVFFDIADACFHAFPDRALQAIDVLREQETGLYYVIETNLGGNSWHFSSSFLQHRVTDEAALRQMTEAKIKQFGAFDVAARVLVEQTKLHAT
jgi:hypothetical protein